MVKLKTSSVLSSILLIFLLIDRIHSDENIQSGNFGVVVTYDYSDISEDIIVDLMFDKGKIISSKKVYSNNSFALYVFDNITKGKYLLRVAPDHESIAQEYILLKPIAISDSPGNCIRIVTLPSISLKINIRIQNELDTGIC